MILFDYDGVLLDSVRESAVTAYSAVSGLTATSLSELPGVAGELFVLNRFHFQPAGDSLLLMEWCLEQTNPERVLSSVEYQNLVLNRASRPVKERTAQFFAARKRFVELDHSSWVALNGVYEPLWGELIKWGAEKPTVLTNKNREAVVGLSHHFGLSLQGENIYSGDGGTSKQENLLKIASRFGAPEYLFIDDHLGNLREVGDFAASQGVALKTALASWGYLGAEDISDARALGIDVYTQQDLISQLA